MDSFRYIPLSALAVVVAAAVAGAVGAAIPGLRAHDRARAAADAARVLLAGALIAVLAVTLAASGGPGGANLVPLRGIAAQVTNLNGAIGALNLLGNVFMFVPLGLLAPTALGWGGRRVVAAALVLSVTIEIAQLSLGRSGDVDDVLLNAIGAGAGVAAAVAVAAMHRSCSETRRARRRPATGPQEASPLPCLQPQASSRVSERPERVRTGRGH